MFSRYLRLDDAGVGSPVWYKATIKQTTQELNKHRVTLTSLGTSSRTTTSEATPSAALALSETRRRWRGVSCVVQSDHQTNNARTQQTPCLPACARARLATDANYRIKSKARLSFALTSLGTSSRTTSSEAIPSAALALSETRRRWRGVSCVVQSDGQPPSTNNPIASLISSPTM